MGRNGVKTGRTYIKLYMSMLIRKNFSYPLKVFLSETLYFELPKNLVICFKGTLASLLLDTTKTFHICLLLLNLKQLISPQLLKLPISENHLNPPKTSASTQNHPQQSKTIYLKTSAITLSQPSPLEAIRSQLESTQSQL